MVGIGKEERNRQPSAPVLLDRAEFTLENPTAQWVRVEKVALDFGSPKVNQSVYFPWGSQLDNWLEATRQRNAIEAENFAMAVAILGLGAGMVSIGVAPGPPAGMRIAGGLATMAAVAGAAAAATSELSAEGATEGPVFFGRHLFAVPIEVPPGLFVKRFVVVNTSGDPRNPAASVAKPRGAGGRPVSKAKLLARQGNEGWSWP